MSIIVSDTVLGALKVTGLPERVEFSSLREFIEALPGLLSVQLPKSITNIVVGKDQPGDDDKDKVWIRRLTNGQIQGYYYYSGDKWKRFYNKTDVEITWIYGNSAEPPEGFVFIDTGDPVINSTVVTALKSQYVANGSGGYYYYATRYVGV